MAFYFPQLDDAQSQGQQDESDSDPLGHLSQLGVQALGLVLGQEGIGTAGNGTGQTGTLTGLQHDDGHQSQRKQNLNNGNSELHVKIVPFKRPGGESCRLSGLFQNQWIGYHNKKGKASNFLQKV